jgi:hypothetical protein
MTRSRERGADGGSVRTEPMPERPMFPADHPLESLRGYPVPDRAQVRRMLAERCAWLELRIGENTRVGRGNNHHVKELAALVQMEAEWTDLRRRRSDVLAEMLGALNTAADGGEVSEEDATRLAEIAGRVLAPPP